MTLRVVLEPSEEGGFTVTVPALPGCISEGDTREEALANIRAAIDLYLEPEDDEAEPGANAQAEWGLRVLSGPGGQGGSR